MEAKDYYVFRSVSELNILPLGSMCNLNCIFCSHKQNPRDINVINLPPIGTEEVKELFDFINPNKKITIGESVTRINEGEPLYHPYIKEILIDLRKKFNDTVIQITTNGSLLNESLIKFLKSLEPIELNISLNTIESCKRKEIMGDSTGIDPTNLLQLLSKYKINYHGSVVLIPSAMSVLDIELIVEKLEKFNSKSLRVFLPGYTKHSPRHEIQISDDESEYFREHLNAINSKVNIPILVEPPITNNLRMIIEGIVPNSPAFKAGLFSGDEILLVDGEEVFSRAEGFMKIKQKSSPTITIKRKEEQFNVTLDKSSKESSGIAVTFDIEKSTINKILSTVFDKKSIVLTSEFGYGPIKMGINKMLPSFDGKVIAVKNNYFGGNIKSAGLLTVSDFRSCLKEQLDGQTIQVILPNKPFDERGFDLRNEHYQNLQDEFGITVNII
ncbi:DUF512 domain-containing protein [Natranaerobius trueperi]|uniref:Radical SAM core domain-containing protein n=1 Tax=Natranaerobius trueperi TaxID=759412 RepID=A0A226C0N8_9FIRM|nr:DUF512 domain-containing protein [Natranaerobius trueperi]OWZ84796.1 hypothetical protein CDO51_01910 [Natranaerobius trueperi]